MAKDLAYVLLLDCYGELLTPKQREAAELYYNEDLSLSEIAESRGITRQAVRDSLRHAEDVLRQSEEKLGMAARLRALRACLEEIRDACPGEDPRSEKITALVRKGLSLL